MTDPDDSRPSPSERPVIPGSYRAGQDLPEQVPPPAGGMPPHYGQPPYGPIPPAPYGQYPPPPAPERKRKVTKVAWVAIGLAVLNFIIGIAGGFSFLVFLMFLAALVLSIVALAQRGGKKALPAIALPLSVVALFVGIGVSASNTPDDEPTTTVVAEPTSDQKAGPSKAAEPSKPALTFPGSTEDDFIAKGGATIERQGVKVTASKLEQGDDTFGNTLCVAVNYVNDSDDEISFYPYDWKLQDPDGKIVDVTFGGSDHALDSADLAPGGKAKGDVCFDGPAKPKGTYIVLWDATFRLSSDRLAWINTL